MCATSLHYTQFPSSLIWAEIPGIPEIPERPRQQALRSLFCWLPPNKPQLAKNNFFSLRLAVVIAL